MTWKASVGISVGIHLVVLLVLGILTIAGRPEEFVTETIRIRIKMQNQAGGHRTASAGEPSGMYRLGRPVSELPTFSTATDSMESPQEVRRRIPSAAVEKPPETAAPSDELDAVDPFLEGVNNLDPIAGLEAAEPTVEDSGSVHGNMWNISWSDGEERDIVEFPKIDTEVLPESTERLSGLEIEIVVSPAGNVKSARVVEPGSGDLRIDRYLVELAGELVLGPVFTEEGDQRGLIHLRLVEVNE